jgi:hypothetical protein
LYGMRDDRALLALCCCLARSLMVWRQRLPLPTSSHTCVKSLGSSPTRQGPGAGRPAARTHGRSVRGESRSVSRDDRRTGGGDSRTQAAPKAACSAKRSQGGNSGKPSDVETGLGSTISRLTATLRTLGRHARKMVSRRERD